jgi:citrate synthase
MRRHFSSFPRDAHPMAILSSMINALQAYDLPHLVIDTPEHFETAAASLISKVPYARRGLVQVLDRRAVRLPAS